MITTVDAFSSLAVTGMSKTVTLAGTAIGETPGSRLALIASPSVSAIVANTLTGAGVTNVMNRSDVITIAI